MADERTGLMTEDSAVPPSPDASADGPVGGPAPIRHHRTMWLSAVALIVAFAAAVLVVPLLIPRTPAPGTVEPAALADAGSRFVEVDGITFHYRETGEGTPTVVLIHGFGASALSWDSALPDMGSRGRVVAFDRPGFGLTERPMPGEWSGPNPYALETQAQQTVALMDALGIRDAVLVGHSAGSIVAALVALEHPDRVDALVLEDPALYAAAPASWLGPLMRTPQGRRVGPLLARRYARGVADSLLDRAYVDTSRLASGTLDAYCVPFGANDWDRGFWEFAAAPRPRGLTERIRRIAVPTLVIAGEEDAIVPVGDAERAAREIPGADLVVLPGVGHVPHEEATAAFVTEIYRFLDTI